MTAQATPTGQRLQALGSTDGIWMGTAVNEYWNLSQPDQGNYVNTLLPPEYNILTSEGDMKSAATEPTQNNFTFANGNKFVAFAQSINADVHGHNLVWYINNPTWLQNGSWTSSTLTAVMENHINNVMAHWKGQIYAWDVVNEALDGTQHNSNWELNFHTYQPGQPFFDPYFYYIGWSYVPLAFQTARAADPNALLLYNDDDCEMMGTVNGVYQYKSDSLYEMVQYFQANDIPIDGIGFESHWGNTIPNYNAWASNLARFSELGLKLFITELDMDNPNGSVATTPSLGNDDEARVYYNLMDKALRCPGFGGCITWEFSDEHSWLNTVNGQGVITNQEYPLPFDTNYAAKPAYYGLQDALATEDRSELTTNGGFESGTSPWNNNGNGNLTIVTSSPSPHSGTNAVEITNRVNSWDGPAQNITTNLLAQGAGRYYLNAWVMFASGSGTAKLTLALNDANGTHYVDVSNASVGTTWTQLSGWVNVSWYKTLNSAILYVETPNSTANFYVDDIRAGDGNIVENGNFESGINWWFGGDNGNLSSSTADAQYHYGAAGAACTGRTASDQSPEQNILTLLQAEGPGNYNFQAYMKLASGTSTGQITLRLVYGGNNSYITAATGTINSTGWTKIASSSPVNVSWTGTLTGAYLYMQTPGTMADLYTDDVVMRQ